MLRNSLRCIPVRVARVARHRPHVIRSLYPAGYMHSRVDAGAVRFRPMLLTAAAVVVGASVILFDPIFQGLAISLMAGEVASTVLSRMTVPVLYYLSQREKHGTTPPLAADLVRATD